MLYPKNDKRINRWPLIVLLPAVHPLPREVNLLVVLDVEIRDTSCQIRLSNVERVNFTFAVRLEPFHLLFECPYVLFSVPVWYTLIFKKYLFLDSSRHILQDVPNLGNPRLFLCIICSRHKNSWNICHWTWWKQQSVNQYVIINIGYTWKTVSISFQYLYFDK